MAAPGAIKRFHELSLSVEPQPVPSEGKMPRVGGNRSVTVDAANRLNRDISKWRRVNRSSLKISNLRPAVDGGSKDGTEEGFANFTSPTPCPSNRHRPNTIPSENTGLSEGAAARPIHPEAAKRTAIATARTSGDRVCDVCGAGEKYVLQRIGGRPQPGHVATEPLLCGRCFGAADCLAAQRGAKEPTAVDVEELRRQRGLTAAVQ